VSRWTAIQKGRGGSGSKVSSNEGAVLAKFYAPCYLFYLYVYFLTVLNVSLSSPVYPRHCVSPSFGFSIGHPNNLVWDRPYGLN
jgi:hypothetical protein